MKDTIIYLQKLMKEQNIDYYYVLSEDYHNSEYSGDYFSCREALSGFTGSAGSLLVSQTSAWLWTDGRYYLQAEKQLEGSGIELMKSGAKGVPKVVDFLKDHLNKGQTLGYDGRTMTAMMESGLIKALDGKNVKLVNDLDLAGKVYSDMKDRPALEFNLIYDYEKKTEMRSRGDKLREVFEKLDRQGVSTYVITMLDEIAYLLNLRGSDVPCNPVFLSNLILMKGDIRLYANGELEPGLEDTLKKDDILVYPYEAFYRDLNHLDGKVGADKTSSNAFVFRKVKASGGVSVKSPVTMMKAVKDEAEIRGMRQAHIKDGVAYAKFLYRLSGLKFNSDGVMMDENGRSLDEVDLGDMLEDYRKEQENYIEPSFDPIVAVKDHGAVIHYSPTKESAYPIYRDTFLLMDTGSQFIEGTTDITRTTALGEVSEEMKADYTAVLKGHLHLLNAYFIKGTRGENLDVLARTPIWERGYDYKHGTGHGVGCFLNVHEGPVSVRSFIHDGIGNSCPFEPGMVVSDEPGIYRDGKYGIRLESLVECVSRETEASSDEEFMGFEALTLVPWDLDSILPDMMTAEEKRWLNAYHERVYRTISPYLDDAESEWLKQSTKAI